MFKISLLFCIKQAHDQFTNLEPHAPNKEMDGTPISYEIIVLFVYVYNTFMILHPMSPWL